MAENFGTFEARKPRLEYIWRLGNVLHLPRRVRCITEPNYAHAGVVYCRARHSGHSLHRDAHIGAVERRSLSLSLACDCAPIVTPTRRNTDERIHAFIGISSLLFRIRQVECGKEATCCGILNVVSNVQCGGAVLRTVKDAEMHGNTSLGREMFEISGPAAMEWP